MQRFVLALALIALASGVEVGYSLSSTTNLLSSPINIDWSYHAFYGLFAAVENRVANYGGTMFWYVTPKATVAVYGSTYIDIAGETFGLEGRIEAIAIKVPLAFSIDSSFNTAISSYLYGQYPYFGLSPFLGATSYYWEFLENLLDNVAITADTETNSGW